MPPLGDAFPGEFRKKFAEINIRIGSVIKTFVTDTTPPKIKRFVILGISVDKLAIGTLYINSAINPNLFPTPELKNLHLKLEKQSRDYLDHDSFLDCSKIYEKEYEDLLAVLQNDTSCLIGQLSSDDLILVKRTVKEARTIPLRTKKKFGLF
ncbi:MAG: hypothetical protein KIT62_04710 [Cyclobacteriaceae bacterium]|nr:hypothetical protein [Cyclobacteriaceae bacterium]